MVGSIDTRLIVLRGNSGSGTSTAGCCAGGSAGEWPGSSKISFDGWYGPSRSSGLATVGLIDQTVRYALDAGDHVVLEGILLAGRY